MKQKTKKNLNFNSTIICNTILWYVWSFQNIPTPVKMLVAKNMKNRIILSLFYHGNTGLGIDYTQRETNILHSVT